MVDHYPGVGTGVGTLLGTGVGTRVGTLLGTLLGTGVGTRVGPTAATRRPGDYRIRGRATGMPPLVAD